MEQVEQRRPRIEPRNAGNVDEDFVADEFVLGGNLDVGERLKLAGSRQRHVQVRGAKPAFRRYAAATIPGRRLVQRHKM